MTAKIDNSGMMLKNMWKKMEENGRMWKNIHTFATL
jgi:hypothetical protein